MWHVYALAAGSLQTVRNASARRLVGRVPVALNSWARFAFCLPCVLLLVVVQARSTALPQLSLQFFLACCWVAMTQLLASVCLMAAFRHGTFAGSVLLQKMDSVIAAVVGALCFAELPSGRAWLGIGLCLVGAVAVQMPAFPKNGRGSFGARTWVPGRGAGLALLAAVMLAGAGFGVKFVMRALREVNQADAGPSWWLPAHGLLHVTWIEVLVLSAVLLFRGRSVFRQVRGNLSTMAVVGVAAFVGSMCWYCAYGSGPVAEVSALGQVEVLLSVGAGLWVFRERRTLRQLPGAGLVLIGILMICLAGRGTG